MEFSNITNNMYTNKYDSETRVTVLAMSENGKVDIFSVPISTPSGNLQVPEDPILGKTRQINDIFQKQGFLGGSTTGTVSLQTKTANISIKDDYVYLSPNGKGIEMSRNVLKSILKGEGFYDQLNDVYRKVVGTNGVIKKSMTTDQNYIFKKLFEIDGRLKIADAATEKGHAITIRNIRTPAYDKTCVYMVFENISKFDESNVEGIRIVYTMNAEVQIQEADDANEVSFTQTQLSDVRYIKEFLIKGFGDDEIGAVNTVTVALGTVTDVDLATNSLTFAGNLQSKLDVGSVVTIDPAGDIVPKTLTVSEIAYFEGSNETLITVTETLTAGSNGLAANTATTSQTALNGVPARPSMIGRIPMYSFKAKIDATADIDTITTAAGNITVNIKVPTEKVALNSITQEYETTAYTPALYDTAVVYITKDAIEAKYPTLKGSAMALAMFDGAKWQLLKAEGSNGKPIKESEMTAGTAYASKADKDAAAAEFSKTLYNIFNWNFEQTQFEKI